MSKQELLAEIKTTFLEALECQAELDNGWYCETPLLSSISKLEKLMSKVDEVGWKVIISTFKEELEKIKKNNS